MPRSTQLYVLLSCAFAQAAHAAEGVEVLHYETLQDYVVIGSSTAGIAKPAAAEPVRLHFTAMGRQFDLILEPNARLGAMLRQLDSADGVVAYRGALADRPGDSWARLVVGPDGASGLISDGTTLYGLERSADTATEHGGGGTVIFRLADVYIAPGSLTCSAADSTTGASAAAMLDSIAGEFEALGQSGAAWNLDIGAVADFEFSQRFGGNATAALLARFNNVDGIFSEQLGVQITVADIDVFTAPGDPFTQNNAQGLLDQLAVYRGATPAQDAQGLTHMFTGRNLAGSTVGMAFVGTVCSRRRPFDPLRRSFGAGLSEGRRGEILDSLIAAHEIGHNFGAPHDAAAGSACQSTPPTFLMAPNISGSDRFSQCSIAQMQPEIAAATCMTAIGEPDLALAGPQPNRTELAGGAFDYTFTATNLGVEPALAASVSATVETGLQILNATASAGSCTSADSSAACDIGNLPGGASRTVTLTLRSMTVGSFGVDAIAAANDDADLGNNHFADTVTIAPVVDLVLSGTSSVLQTNQQTTLAATLDNSADFEASSIVLTAALTDGLRPDQLTLGGIACSISGQIVSCPTQSLAARASAALELTVTGLTAGLQEVSLGVVAAESEQTPGDNSVVITVSVTAPPPPTESGGGGAISWWSLLWLGAALWPALARSAAPCVAARVGVSIGSRGRANEDQRTRCTIEPGGTLRAARV
jgi:hypothetical protein